MWNVRYPAIASTSLALFLSALGTEHGRILSNQLDR